MMILSLGETRCNSRVCGAIQTISDFPKMKSFVNIVKG